MLTPEDERASSGMWRLDIPYPLLRLHREQQDAARRNPLAWVLGAIVVAAWCAALAMFS